jgi:hypothetical protein
VARTLTFEHRGLFRFKPQKASPVIVQLSEIVGIDPPAPDSAEQPAGILAPMPWATTLLLIPKARRSPQER